MISEETRNEIVEWLKEESPRSPSLDDMHLRLEEGIKLILRAILEKRGV